MQSDDMLKGLLTKEELAYLLSSSPAEDHDDLSSTAKSMDSDQQDRTQHIIQRWEMTIRELEKEIIELRTRVSRLENGFEQGSQTPRMSQILPISVDPPEQSASLSRVEKYKSMRWGRS